MKKYLPPVGLFAILFALYFLTMAPDITWANGGTDGGDLVTAAATGGIAHPSGYPTYLLLAGLFQHLPVGSLAFRTHLLSAVSMALAAVMVYFITERYLAAQSTRALPYAGGLLAGLSFGLAPVAWSQAVIAEVYGLHAFFVALLLALMAAPASRASLLTGIVFGLALGNHLTTILLLPLLLLVTPGQPSSAEGGVGLRTYLASMAYRLAGVLLGLLVYGILPLRAAGMPPVNWGNPSHFDGFLWLVSGKMYQQSFVFELPVIWEKFRAAAALLLAQFGALGVALSLAGLSFSHGRSVLLRNTLYTTFAFSLFAIFYGTIDSYFYLIPVFMCFSIWLGIGLDGLTGLLRQMGKRAPLALSLAAFLYLAGMAVSTYPQVDASRDRRAQLFWQAISEQAPPQALVFARGDKAVFTLWYYHFALGNRPDMAVIASDLLHYPWYLETLSALYPHLLLEQAYPWPETVVAQNPGLPVCYLQDEIINCPESSSPKK